MNDSKKVKMVLAGIGGTLLVLLIRGLFPDLPDSVIEWAIGVIGGVPSLGALGQSLADGMSRGLTSSNAPRIISAELQKNLSAPSAAQG
ncbi:hypothetical protein LLH00_12280 [bacterium]|nr:hypothetical protein [bacterium]